MQNQRILIILLAVLISGCARYKAEDAMLKSIQEKMSEMNQRMESLRLKLKDLEDAIFILNDRVKEMENKQALLQNQLQRIKEHMLASTQHPKQKKVQGSKPSSSLSAASKKIMSPENLYRRAYDLIMSTKYDKAIKLLLEFLQDFPQHSLADNAAYWLGECYYTQKDYESALNYFLMVIEDYPNGNKVPDALLKLAYTYEKLGNMEKSKFYLHKLLTEFPFSEPAEKAKIKLKKKTQ